MITTEVAFRGSPKGVISRLEVRSSAPNLMSVLREALFDLRVQVVRTSAWYDQEHQTVSLEVVEFDGGQLRAGRRHQIQAELSALLVTRIPPPPPPAPPARRGWRRGSRRGAPAAVAHARVSW